MTFDLWQFASLIKSNEIGHRVGLKTIGTWRRMVLQQGVVEGVKQTIPIALGYIPVGFAFGVLAKKTGLSDLNTLLMSVIVFAGSAQLIAVGLIGSGASAVSVVVTTFIVNLRHLLMSASLSPFLRKWRRSEVAAMTFQLTDETFGLHAVRFGSGQADKAETLVINMVAQLSWICGTWLGLASSRLISDVRPFGLDFALPAMFAALLVAQVRDLSHVVVALFSGGLAVLLLWLGVEQWSVMLATVAGATIGLGVSTWIRG